MSRLMMSLCQRRWIAPTAGACHVPGALHAAPSQKVERTGAVVGRYLPDWGM